MSTLDRYLLSYVRRRRWIAIARAACFAIAFGSTWLTIWTLLIHRLGISDKFLDTALILGGFTMLAIVARPVSFLFRRFDAVAVAVEIETYEPAFDQRLITVVSQHNGLEIKNYLIAQIQPIVSKRPGKLLVPVRPLIFPMVVMICAQAVYTWVLHHFIHIVR